MRASKAMKWERRRMWERAGKDHMKLDALVARLGMLQREEIKFLSPLCNV